MRQARWPHPSYWLVPLIPVLAALAALLVGAVMLLALGVNPLQAYAALLVGAFGSPHAIADTVVKATPLLFVGVGICISFRGGMINIEGEDQFILGGALWGLVPGDLKAYSKTV